MSLAEQIRAQQANDCADAYSKGIFFGAMWGFVSGMILSSIFITCVVIWAK